MRLLYLHHGKGRERRRDQAYPPPVQFRNHKIKQEDGQQIRQRGGLPRKVFRFADILVVGQLYRNTRQRHRQIAIYKECLSTIIWIQRRLLCIKIFPNAPALFLSY